jgi:Ni/Fe-hydrogenase subunit HybB-like protein
MAQNDRKQTQQEFGDMTDGTGDLLNSIRKILKGSPSGRSPRVIFVKSILWLLTGIATTIAVARFARGLGAVTALTDGTPWGLWIGFDVMSGVALAAGGFIVAATVYVFRLERYRPLLRPAVLTAFLGYVAVVLGLLFDLGLAWNLWRPMFFWQHHSALFEVAWCVMLYLTVLALEFAPVVFEKMPFPRVYKLLKKITLPLVILGIMLSTLHQSSLGSLFLVMPFRLHPLWYSPLLPQLFFVSAIGLGLAMIGLEARITGWMYKREPEEDLLRGFARAASWMLFIYALLRLTDLAARGQLVYLTEFSWESALFIFEMLLSALLPATLLAFPRMRASRTCLTICSILVVSGMILYRINISGIATITVTGSRYFPMWTEFAISIGVVSFIALIFFFFVERFDVYGEKDEGQASEKIGIPEQDPVSQVRLATPWAGPSAVYSLIFIIAAAATAGLLPGSVYSGVTPEKNPANPVRLISAEKILDDPMPYAQLRLENSTVSLNPTGRETIMAMLIDADRNDRYVVFDHDGHAKRAEETDDCAQCHHMNRPFDRATPCSACHKDAFVPFNIFSHDLHVKKVGGEESCIQCHTDASRPRNVDNSIDCTTCHTTWDSSGDPEDSDRSSGKRIMAPGYADAMHTLCIGCHQEAIKDDAALGEDFSRCGTCHVENDLKSLESPSPYHYIKMNP